MGIIEVVSHILSYTRLVGIFLASVILALVINKISLGLFGSGNIGLFVVGTGHPAHRTDVQRDHRGLRAGHPRGPIDLRRVLLEVLHGERAAVPAVRIEADLHGSAVRAGLAHRGYREPDLGPLRAVRRAVP